MLNFKCIILVFSIVSLCLGMAYAIKCWDCNSLHNPGCGDPFDDSNFDLADCSQKFLPRYPNQPGAICRKIIQKVNDEYRYIRGCGYIGEDGLEVKSTQVISSDCIKRAGTFSVLVQYCSCNSGNGCNHAGRIIISYISVLIPVVMVIGRVL